MISVKVANFHLVCSLAVTSKKSSRKECDRITVVFVVVVVFFFSRSRCRHI